MKFELEIKDNGDIVLSQEGSTVLRSRKVAPVLAFFRRYISEQRTGFKVLREPHTRGRPYIVNKEIIESLREEYANNVTLVVLAKKYRISQSTIYNIIKGRHTLAEGLPDIIRPRRKYKIEPEPEPKVKEVDLSRISALVPTDKNHPSQFRRAYSGRPSIP